MRYGKGKDVVEAEGMVIDSERRRQEERSVNRVQAMVAVKGLTGRNRNVRLSHRLWALPLAGAADY